MLKALYKRTGHSPTYSSGNSGAQSGSSAQPKDLTLQQMHSFLTQRDNSANQILGVSANASPAEIKARYYELAKKYAPFTYLNHPENIKRQATVVMQFLNGSYEQLLKYAKQR